MGLDRAKGALWFQLAPAPGWPVAVAGLATPSAAPIYGAIQMGPAWAATLVDRADRVATCPLAR